MAAPRAIPVDISVFSVGGIALLTEAHNMKYTVVVNTVKTKPINRVGQRSQGVSKKATLSFDRLQTITTPIKATNAHISVQEIGGVSYRCDIVTGTFTGSFTTRDGKGQCDEWAYHQVIDKDYSYTCDMLVPATAGHLLMELVHGTLDELEAVFSITINSAALTLPMIITEASWMGDDGDYQKFSCKLEGQSPDSGNYPTAPTGTTTIVEKALNAPLTAVAVLLTTKAVGGSAYSGNFVFSSFGFSHGSEQEIKYNFELVNQGEITHAPTTA